MTRKRTIIQGKSYYVTVRTDGGRKYLASPLAKTMFVDMLTRLEARHACRIDNFVVLDDGIRLIVQPTEGAGLDQSMNWLLDGYTRQYNRAFDGAGRIFGGTYDSKPILGMADLERTFRRIDQAPVLEGLVTDTMDWEWCGLRQRGSRCRDVLEGLSQRLTLEFSDGSVFVGYCT
jgi:REP element-mobilizing transposase RayT